MKKFQNKYRIPTARATWWDYMTGSYFITICTHNRLHWFGQIQDKKMKLSPFGEIAQQCWMDLPNHFPYVELGAFTVMPNHIHGIIDIIDTLHATSDGPVDDNMAMDTNNTIETLYNDNTVETLHATSNDPVDDNMAMDTNGTMETLHNDDIVETLHATSNGPVDDNMAMDTNGTMETLSKDDTVETLHATSLQMARISPKRGSLARVLGSYKSAISNMSHKIDATFEWQERYHDHIIRDTEEYNGIEYYINHNPENWEDDCFNK